MASHCTVIARFRLITCEPERLLGNLRGALPVLAPCAGFQGAQILIKEDESEIATVTKWADRSCYDALQANPELIDAGMELFELIQTEAVDMQIDVYETVQEESPS